MQTTRRVLNRRPEPGIVPPLRAVRRAQGLSLREVAKRARIDSGQLSRVERGKESLSIKSLARVAEVLGLDDLAQQLAPYIDVEEELDDVNPIEHYYIDAGVVE